MRDVTVLQALSPTKEEAACMAPAFSSPCIQAYSYVKREVLKTYYALGGHCSAAGKFAVVYA
jgi:hypothetical protein